MDNTSTASEKDVAAQASKDGIPIYAVGIGDPNAKGMRDVAIGRFILGGPNAAAVDPASLEALSAAAGGRSFIVPATGEDKGKGFKTATSAIADNIAKGYAIGAVVPADVTPSTVKATVVKRLDLVVRAHPIAAAP
jgi:hypothetical protein